MYYILYYTTFIQTSIDLPSKLVFKLNNQNKFKLNNEKWNLVYLLTHVYFIINQYGDKY